MSAGPGVAVPDGARAGLRIRAMEENDLDRVVSIERASFAAPWSRETFERLLDQGNATALVAQDDEEVVGYAIFWKVRDEAELGNLAVDPGHRRQGVARRLLRSVLGMTRRAGAAALYLEVRESNTAARALYGSEEFRNVGRRRGYYRSPPEDALVLRRSLRAPSRPETPAARDR